MPTYAVKLWRSGKPDTVPKRGPDRSLFVEATNEAEALEATIQYFEWQDVRAQKQLVQQVTAARSAIGMKASDILSPRAAPVAAVASSGAGGPGGPPEPVAAPPPKRRGRPPKKRPAE